MSEFIPDHDSSHCGEYTYYTELVRSRALVNLPPDLQLDWVIRTALEWAVFADEATILKQTKAIMDGELELQGETVIIPTASQKQDVLEGVINEQLKTFVYATYDLVVECFDAPVFEGWCVAPYFEEGDDTHRFHQVGLFINRNFCKQW